MLEVERHANGRSVTTWSGRPLGVICTCGHRATIPLRLLKVGEGDMTRVYDRPIVCSKCGERRFKLYIFRTPEEMDAFRATLPPPPTAAERASPGAARRVPAYSNPQSLRVARNVAI